MVPRDVDPDVANVAVTAVLDDTVTLQAPVPEQAPLHPVKVEPEDGVAVSVTEVPDVRADEVQVEPQDMPPTDDVTVPVPLPDGVIERVYVLTLPACVVALVDDDWDEVFPAASYADTVYE